jgi:low temperature requirement protein LtrA
MAFAFVVRWWYFDVAQNASERHIRNRRQGVMFQIWKYAHLPLYLGIGVAGVGFERMIRLTETEQLSHDEILLLCSAVALLSAALAVTGAMSRKPRTSDVLRQIALAFSIAVLGIAARGLDRVLVTLILVGVGILQTAMAIPRSRALQHERAG